MTREDTLTSWSQGPGATEAAKCENAERGVREALAASRHLQPFQYRVFTQGSYRARTNVRQNSDVDICICQTDQFSFDLPQGAQRAASEFGINTVSSNYEQFKSAVGRALVERFGAGAVSRGNKAWDVHANSYRVDADVVAAREFREYFGSYQYREGTVFWADSGERITNWPEQSYNNGVAKNEETQRKFKRVVRILKRCRDSMQVARIEAARDVASFLIESLVWNVPTANFSAASYSATTESVLQFLIAGANSEALSREWTEVNDVKYLFRTSQPWTRQQALEFLVAARAFISNL